VFRLH